MFGISLWRGIEPDITTEIVLGDECVLVTSVTLAEEEVIEVNKIIRLVA